MIERPVVCGCSLREPRGGGRDQRLTPARARPRPQEKQKVPNAWGKASSRLDLTTGAHSDMVNGLRAVLPSCDLRRRNPMSRSVRFR